MMEEKQPLDRGPFDPYDEKHFIFVYEKAFKLLHKECTKIIHDGFEAKDIVSDSFRKLLEHLRKTPEKFQSFNNVQGFLFRTVRNASIDYLREKRPEMSVDEDFEQIKWIKTEALTYALEERDLYQKVLADIARLPPRSKEIMRLSFVEGLNSREVAIRLGLKPKSIQKAKARILENLRQKLKRKEHPIESQVFIFLFCLALYLLTKKIFK